MRETLSTRLKHAWNVFVDNDRRQGRQDHGSGSYRRPDRNSFMVSSEKNVVTAIYNRLAIDVAAISLKHVRVDQNGSYKETIHSGLNDVLTVEANLDQTGRAFLQDIAMSLFDEGCVAVVPTETSFNPAVSTSYQIDSMRVGQITQWYPKHVRVKLYNAETGLREDVVVLKRTVAIIENPLFAVMNEPNSTLKRLINKLNLLDAVDEQSGSGKLDIIIQLPYVIKSEARRLQAEQRRNDIEMQLKGSQYGIAYTDGTEKITQLNRASENNLMGQVEFLTSMLYSQLGLTEAVFDGTADEATMLNYYNRTIEPVIAAISDEMHRKFLTKTARTQMQAIAYFRDPFKLVPVSEIADMADKLTRNEILSSNEVRGIIGFRPSSDPKADELRNKNLNSNGDEEIPEGSKVDLKKTKKLDKGD